MSYQKNPNYEFEGWVRIKPKRKFHYYPEDECYARCGSESRYAYPSSSASESWDKSTTVPADACRICTKLTGQINLDELPSDGASDSSMIRLMHGNGNETGLSISEDSITFLGKTFKRQGDLFVEAGWNAIPETLSISTSEGDKEMVQVLTQGLVNQFVAIRKVVPTTVRVQVFVVEATDTTEVSVSGLRLEQKNEE